MCIYCRLAALPVSAASIAAEGHHAAAFPQTATMYSHVPLIPAASDQTPPQVVADEDNLAATKADVASAEVLLRIEQGGWSVIIRAHLHVAKCSVLSTHCTCSVQRGQTRMQ